VEVSNNSDTDPCAWVGVVDKLGKTIKVGSLICLLCFVLSLHRAN
jgi:hypothetical protein